MFEFLVHIPGPTYLAIYGIGTLLILAAAWYMSLDDSLRYKEPPPSKFDSITIATLLGRHHVIRTVVFSLWNRDLIHFEGSDDNPQLKSAVGPEQGETPIEKIILQFLRHPHHPTVLFANPQLKQDLDKELAPIEDKLTRAHLKLDPDTKKRKVKIAWMVVLVLFSAGVLKLIFGVSRNKPVGFLILEMIVALILLLVVLRPWKKVTRLGDRYLKQLKKHFQWVKDAIENGKVPNGLDPALPLAVFGTGMFTNIPAFQSFSDRFGRSSHSTGTGCGGCSVSSSDGDGGGGCGGGCGGCGG